MVIAVERSGELDHLFKNERATRIVRKSAAKSGTNDIAPARKRIVYGTAIIWGWDGVLDMSTDLPLRYQPSDFEICPLGLY
jgi:hypothetical protein